MSDSILQVNQIKDKGGNATGITVADSTANISIGTNLAVNTINEVTSANGVTIDGLSLKDGNVVPADGKGIDFSAHSNTATGSDDEVVETSILDDYETGEFDPYIPGYTAGSNMLGMYVKVGNKVTVHISVQIHAASVPGAGTLNIAGLPFVHNYGAVDHSGLSSLGSSAHAVSIWRESQNEGDYGGLYLNHNETSVYLRTISNGNVSPAGNDKFTFLITYFTQ